MDKIKITEKGKELASHYDPRSLIKGENLHRAKEDCAWCYWIYTGLMHGHEWDGDGHLVCNTPDGKFFSYEFEVVEDANKYMHKLAKEDGVDLNEAVKDAFSEE